MNEGLYKSMYEKIQLNEGQKAEILNGLDKPKETGRRKQRFAVYAAACLCVVFMSNAAVFAAVHFNLVERLETEVNRFLMRERSLTEEQKAVYEQQGTGIEQEIKLEYGTMQFDSMLCDQSYLFLPFTFRLDEQKKEQLLNLRHSDWEKQILRVEFAVNGKHLGKISYLPTAKLRETGEIHGDFMLTGSFQQGEIIQIWELPDAYFDEMDKLGKPICELTVAEIPAAQNIAVPSEPLTDKLGVEIDKITLSPLSLKITGTYQNQNIAPFYIDKAYVELKDGTRVKESPTGSGFGCGDPVKEPSAGSGFGCGEDTEDRYSFEMYKIFESPISIDDVKGIYLRMKNWTDYYYIPMQAE